MAYENYDKEEIRKLELRLVVDTQFVLNLTPEENEKAEMDLFQVTPFSPVFLRYFQP